MLCCPSPHAFAAAHLRVRAIVLALLVFAPLALAEDWEARVRTCVQNKDLPAAITIVEDRLQTAPDDLEARGWHGRLLAWTGKWEAAEDEYRYVLRRAPNDVDILSGLADVLSWRERFDEALLVLNDAQALAPNRTDILVKQGRVLRALHRNREAKEKFLAALAFDGGNAEARQGVESLRPEPRHELRFGTDNDLYNYTDTAYAQGISVTSKWNPRWSTSFAETTYQRFGEDAAQFSGSTTWRYAAHNAVTVGGAVAHDSGVIPRAQAFFELGRGFTVSREGMVRGIEARYQQRWLWFADARVLALTAAATFYLPNDFTWSISITPARSRFPLTQAAWQTSGLTRLAFPLFPRVTGNAFYAVGTENFAQQDQIGRFSARTMGGGTRIQLTPRQDISGYIANQDRSQGRTQISLGMSYGIRF